jgi:hypothetical protein
MVADIIEANREKIAVLCRQYRVRTLWVFGSATTPRWNPEQSDIDLLVDLGEYSQDYAARFFGLRRDLQSVFQLRVDLLSSGGLEDKPGRFASHVEATRESLYDARYDQLVA